MFRYRLILEADDNGTILVTSPDLPLVTYGDDKADALRHAVDAAVAILSSLMEAREDITAGAGGEAERCCSSLAASGHIEAVALCRVALS